MSSVQYASFLIRLWREAAPDAAEVTADWRSEVEHIQTGERWTFETLDEMLRFLRRGARDPGTAHPLSSGQDQLEAC
jgi:hypothetical protein